MLINGRINSRTLLIQLDLEYQVHKLYHKQHLRDINVDHIIILPIQMLMIGGSKDLVTRISHSMVQPSSYLNHLRLTQVSQLVSRTLYLVNQIIQQQSQLIFRLLVNSYLTLERFYLLLLIRQILSMRGQLLLMVQILMLQTYQMRLLLLLIMDYYLIRKYPILYRVIDSKMLVI